MVSPAGEHQSLFAGLMVDDALWGKWLKQNYTESQLIKDCSVIFGQYHLGYLGQWWNCKDGVLQWAVFFRQAL